MKKKIINEKNENGLYSKTILKEKTSEDGFVYENKEHIVASWNETNQPIRSVWHKGYTKKITYITNDPRITRPFIQTFSGIFFCIGIILLLLHLWFLGISFIAVSLFIFFKGKQDIDSIAEDLKKQGHDITIDSEEEKEAVQKEFINSIKNNFSNATSSVFTKKHFSWFSKTIPIYCIISIITSLFITIFVNIILGLLVLGICILVGFFYYYFVSKIFKH